MGLTEEDLDRIGDKVDLSVMKAMAEHQKVAHTPLEDQVDAVSKRVWTMTGIYTAAAGFLGFLLKK